MKHITQLDLNGIPLVAGQTNGEGLIWNGTNWVNSSTPLLRTATSSGTVNYIPKFTPSGTELGDSQIFDNGTNVGVNIFTGLSAKLHVKGAGNTSATNGLIVENSSGTQSLVVRDDGRVGIGTTSPSGRLHIYGTSSGFNIYNYLESNNTASQVDQSMVVGIVGVGQGVRGSTMTGLDDYGAAATGYIYQGGSCVGYNFCTSLSTSYWRFYSGNAAPANTATLTVVSGAVGINTHAPTARLHVKGSGSTSATNTAIFENSSGAQSLVVRDDGSVYNRGGGSIDTNTAFGIGALISNTTGIRSTAFGYFAGNNNTGDRNVFFGYNSGASNTSGDDNVFIGHNAGLLSSTSLNNVVIGSDAGSSGSLSQFNVIVGFKSGEVSAGQKNTFSGAFSGYRNTSGAENTIIGYGAGQFITTGSGNVILGNLAGTFETGSNKLFIDNQLRADEATGRTDALIYGVFNATPANQELRINASLGVNIAPTSSVKFHVKGSGSTSATNTAIFENSSGAQSLVVRDDGSVYNLGGGSVLSNLAFGESALISNTTGSGNVALGQESLSANTGGIANVGVGKMSLRVLSSGDENTAVGDNALFSLSSGSNNVSVGSAALFSKTSGGNATAVGYQSQQYNTTGNGNTSLGYQSLRNNLTGADSVAIGYQSIYNSTGSNITALGYQAGWTNVSGERGVYLGYQAGFYETLSDSLYIHNGLGVTTLANGRTNSLIYGVFNATPANQELRINAGLILMAHLPTSSAGLPSGALWNNGGVLNIV